MGGPFPTFIITKLPNPSLTNPSPEPLTHALLSNPIIIMTLGMQLLDACLPEPTAAVRDLGSYIGMAHSQPSTSLHFPIQVPPNHRGSLQTATNPLRTTNLPVCRVASHVDYM